MSADDPFGTEALRDRVLAGWVAGVARFREDANAEEDHALGGYRDRLVIELAQNAADAAARAGVPGRLRLTLADGELTAANTGAPLDAPGVEALATLRASAKRGTAARQAVGRFGVGFAAVLAVTNRPAVVSSTGAVRWSADEARALATAASPAVAAEVGRRAGAVPLLRLPLAWPDAPPPPAGFTTVVRLPLRDAAAAQLAERLLDEVDATLLLALPALARLELTAGGRTRRLTADRGPDSTVVIDDTGAVSRWCTATIRGQLTDALLADRPVEERARRSWSLTWAVPVDDTGRPVPLPASVPAVVRAPTPTDEPLSLPAVLLADFPLDPSRRHVTPGPLTDALATAAGAAYAELLASLPADPAVLALVPTGIGAGALDVAVRRAALSALPDTPLLPAAEDSSARQRGRDAVSLAEADDDLDAVLAPVIGGLLPAAWASRGYRTALAALGVREVALAEVVDALAGLDRPPSWWRTLYAALDAAVPPGPSRDALGTLPVPLADGRLATGPRGLLLPRSTTLPSALDPLGLRVVDPNAAHPLLAALGAVPATPAGVLTDPRVQAAVAASYDADDPWPVAEAVLGLVAAAAPAPGEMPWLGELALPGDDGDWYVAGELLLPGGRLAGWVARDAPFGILDASVVDRWGADVALAVGVLDGFAVLTATEVLLDPNAAELDLDDGDGYLAAVADLADPTVLHGPGDRSEDVHRFGPLGRAGSPDRAGSAGRPGSPDRADRADRAGSPDRADRAGSPDRADRADRVDRVDRPDRTGVLPNAHGPAVVAEVRALRDLELVRVDAWPEVLAALAAPPLRELVVTPAWVVLADGRSRTVPSYTAWWLARHARLDGRPLSGYGTGDATVLFDPVPLALDDEFLAAGGVQTSLDMAVDLTPEAVLDRLADPSRVVPVVALWTMYRRLAENAPDVEPPERLRAVRRDGTTAVADADDVVAVETPDLLPLLGDRLVLPVAAGPADRLADVLAVAVAGELADYRVASEPATVLAWRDIPGATRAAELAGRPVPDTTVAVHDRLLVTDTDGNSTPVRWRAESTMDHVRGGDAGALGRALAWRLGRFELRDTLAGMLKPDGDAGLAVLEAWFDVAPDSF